ncbi:MAG: flagellar hook-basal body complex protein FliE, partial [Chitinispirillaceae bacterium]|nr:flagellar hook-basal body complex protein FliE [Chitinispirillaceae bacterium]
QINPVGPIREQGATGKTQGVKTRNNAPSFAETLQGFLKDVNSMQVKADESIEKMAAGEITDVHQVMSTVEEANVAFNMMMEIRNKVMDAYQEVMRIRL